MELFSLALEESGGRGIKIAEMFENIGKRDTGKDMEKELTERKQNK